MKKRRYAKKFLEALSEIGIVASACKKAGISRNTAYRWCEEDREFGKEMEKALNLGTEQTNDFALSKEIQAIQNGEPWAIKHWLDNHHKNYIRPRLPSFLEGFSNNRKVNGFEVIIHHAKNEPKSSYRGKKTESDNRSPKT